MEDSKAFDPAFGSLLGALVGDAAGATLEFLGRQPDLDEVDRALKMVGGGVFELAPGQITDDGELTLCLARALAETVDFDIHRIAQGYAKWVASAPFDIGFTTRSSLGAGSHLLDSPAELYGTIRAAAQSRCMGSKANGSLMRATPLGIWGSRLPPDGLAKFARQDSELSHPNESCCDAVACYTIAIASLVRLPGDRDTAWNTVLGWASNHAVIEVREWLRIVESDEKVPFHPQSGFVKIALIHAFRHLLAGNDFPSALRETLSGGGDTDTNACIVGGLIGAACGAQGIPSSQADAVLNCQHSEGTKRRPDFLKPDGLPDLVRRLLGDAGY